MMLLNVQKYRFDATQPCPLVKKRNQQNTEYENYKKEVDYRNDIKSGQRIVSPFVIGYGLAVVASSSLSSALLSIERNTIKKED